jgi:hypothetical protein
MNNITIDYVNNIINEYENNIKSSKKCINNLKNISFKLSYEQIKKKYTNDMNDINYINNESNKSNKSNKYDTNLKNKIKELNL